MPFPYYTETPQKRTHDGSVEIPIPDRLLQEAPQDYDPDPGLVNAVNVALMLGQSLLVTGEPGTGKTQLAYSVAYQLGHENDGNLKPIKFETKSSSKSGDLFYTFDTLRRFRASHDSSMSQNNRDYIDYGALGKAILFTLPPPSVTRWVQPRDLHQKPRRSVVLIDEVDKAPRDFPNDILNEIDNKYFKVIEISPDPIEADPNLWPVIILTSNSEKHLPDAFLRRCIYYDIPFPEPERLAKIVKRRITKFKTGSEDGSVAAEAEQPNKPLLDDALSFFFGLRRHDNQLYKKPATAELLGWLNAMLALGANVEEKLSQRVKDASGKSNSLAKVCLSALVKNSDDQKLAQHYLAAYSSGNST